MKQPCECGAGIRLEGETMTIQPHDMGCATLRTIVERSKTHCTACDLELCVERGGEVVYCPAGCTHKASGEAALEGFDAVGSGWIREELSQ